ncbi:methionine ABC transporter ATP-binding protein [Martelella mediterranea]|uniref:Cell division ATP-binding protein FtsE n=1 Tax=Martelella mediterranea TaxID=293089 RepID=A0A4R3NNY6_9HYPH|nr:D-methionine transport system ATP-binding protein [Martelella mediterranea]
MAENVSGLAEGQSADQAPPMVSFENVTKTFNSRETGGRSFNALDDVSYSVPAGAITGIIGRSGAGKSTLVRLVNGLEKPSSGRVIVDGTDVSGLDEVALRSVRRSIGMIFQHFNLLSSRTVYDNIAMPLEIAGMSKQDIKKRIEPLIDLVGLSERTRHYPAQLSGGQKQRVGIARALASKPKLLLSDEATSALDPETTQQILSLLKTINRDLGLTVLLITHEMEVVKAVTSRVAVMDQGQIAESGRTFDVFTAPQHETTRSMLAALPGGSLPDWIGRQVIPEPQPGCNALIRLRFFGETADQPLVSRLMTVLGSPVNIIAGTVDEIAGEPYGTLYVAYSADPEVMANAQQFFSKTGLNAEVVGYVA